MKNYPSCRVMIFFVCNSGVFLHQAILIVIVLHGRRPFVYFCLQVSFSQGHAQVQFHDVAQTEGEKHTS